MFKNLIDVTYILFREVLPLLELTLFIHDKTIMVNVLDMNVLKKEITILIGSHLNGKM